MRSPYFLLLAICFAPAPRTQTPDFEAPWIQYDTGASTAARMPWSMRQADLDGDGDLDVAVINGDAIPKLSILLGRGDGTFLPPALYNTASGFWDDARDLALADFDRDGDLDVVATNTGNSGSGKTVALHRNRGDGTFAPFVRYSTGPGPTGIAAADFDGDGWVDVATADLGRLRAGTTVSLLLNNGSGGFRPPDTVTVPTAPYRVVAGDLDKDGRPDLAVAHEGNLFTLLLNRYPQWSQTTVTVNGSGGAWYPCIELADLDRDGDLDVCYSSLKTGFQGASGRGTLEVRYNDGSGGIGGARSLVTLPATQGAVDLAVADWSGDGWPDVVSAHMHDGVWEMFESNGSGGYLPPVQFQAAEYSIAIDAADINGDPEPDLLVLGRHSLGLCVYENPFGANLSNPPTYPFTTGALLSPRGMSSADIDGDGDVDLGAAWAGVSSTTGGVGILRNRGRGTFAAPQIYATPIKARALKLRDLNGDALADMVWGDDFPPYAVHTRLNLGNGSFGPQATHHMSGCKLGDVEAFDFDNDGDNDLASSIVASCGFKHPVSLRLNNGNGTFGGPYTHELSSSASFMTHADIDGDGNEDLVTNSGFQGIEVSLGNGDGTFAAPINGFTDFGPKSIAVADLDGDGLLDVATSNMGQDESTVSVLIGFGDGGFWPAVNYLSAYDPSLGNAGAIVAGDTDGDGDVDLMTVNYTSKDASFFRNRGDGTFDPQIRYGVGETNFGLIWDDFTGDGRQDLAVGISPGAALSFYPAALILRGTKGSPWADLGFGMAGERGVPSLSSNTPFAAGSSTTLDLQNGASSALGVHFFGFQTAELSLFGGVLVPSPQAAAPFATDSTGATSLTLPIPNGFPSGLRLYVQSWIVDSAGPFGFAASNGLRGIHY